MMMSSNGNIFPRYWPFVRGIHRWPVNSPHKGQWRGTLMFPLICVWINGWVNNSEAGDLRCYQANYDVTVMLGMDTWVHPHVLMNVVTYPCWVAKVAQMQSVLLLQSLWMGQNFFLCRPRVLSFTFNFCSICVFHLCRNCISWII